MRLCGIIAVLVLALTPSPLAGGGGGEARVFALGVNGAIVVPVTVDGHGPFRFLLDTGASRSAVSARLVRRLRSSVVAQTPMVTATGQAMRPVTRLARVALAPASSVAVMAVILAEETFVRGPAVDGLIGQDVLAPLAYTIDYGRKQIVWHSPGEPTAPGTRLPLEWHEGRFVVSLARKSASSRPLQLVPDSGATGFVLFARPGRELPPVTRLGAVVLTTLLGQRAARSALIDHLEVGDVRLLNQRAVIVDGAASPGTEDGLLPLHLFSRVTVNGPKRYLIVAAARKRG
ncbi:MAG: aspartyl protease family protein [Vicinamibacterales bacterium]